MSTGGIVAFKGAIPGIIPAAVLQVRMINSFVARSTRIRRSEPCTDCRSPHNCRCSSSLGSPSPLPQASTSLHVLKPWTVRYSRRYSINWTLIGYVHSPWRCVGSGVSATVQEKQVTLLTHSCNMRAKSGRHCKEGAWPPAGAPPGPKKVQRSGCG